MMGVLCTSAVQRNSHKPHAATEHVRWGWLVSLSIILTLFLPHRLPSRPGSGISWSSHGSQKQKAQSYRGPWRSSSSTSSCPGWPIWGPHRTRRRRPWCCFSDRAPPAGEEGCRQERQNSVVPQHTLGSPRGPYQAPGPTPGHLLFLRRSVGGPAAWPEMSLIWWMQGIWDTKGKKATLAENLAECTPPITLEL